MTSEKDVILPSSFMGVNTALNGASITEMRTLTETMAFQMCEKRDMGWMSPLLLPVIR